MPNGLGVALWKRFQRVQLPYATLNPIVSLDNFYFFRIKSNLDKTNSDKCVCFFVFLVLFIVGRMVFLEINRDFLFIISRKETTEMCLGKKCSQVRRGERLKFRRKGYHAFVRALRPGRKFVPVEAIDKRENDPDWVKESDWRFTANPTELNPA